MRAVVVHSTVPISGGSCFTYTPDSLNDDRERMVRVACHQLIINMVHRVRITPRHRNVLHRVIDESNRSRKRTKAV
jgi:hypothetical protein